MPPPGDDSAVVVIVRLVSASRFTDAPMTVAPLTSAVVLPPIKDSAIAAPPVWLNEASATVVAFSASDANMDADPSALDASRTAPPVTLSCDELLKLVVTLAASGIFEVAEATLPAKPGAATASIVTLVIADTFSAELVPESAPVAVIVLAASMFTTASADPSMTITFSGQFCTEADTLASTRAPICTRLALTTEAPVISIVAVELLVITAPGDVKVTPASAPGPVSSTLTLDCAPSDSVPLTVRLAAFRVTAVMALASMPVSSTPAVLTADCSDRLPATFAAPSTLTAESLVIARPNPSVAALALAPPSTSTTLGAVVLVSLAKVRLSVLPEPIRLSSAGKVVRSTWMVSAMPPFSKVPPVASMITPPDSEASEID